MREFEELAKGGAYDEIIRKGKELIGNDARRGGAVQLIQELSRIGRHEEAIELAHSLFVERRKARELNILMSAALESKDHEKIKKTVALAKEYEQDAEYQYHVQLISTWLRALLQIDDEEEFWRVYNFVCQDGDRRGNPYIIAQYYQMLIATGRYAEVTSHFEAIPDPIKRDDLLRKLKARAHIELGQIEKAEGILKGARDDYLTRSLHRRIQAFKSRRGVSVTSREAAITETPILEHERPVLHGKPRIFIVYGRDLATMAAVENVLHRIGAEPLVFDRLPKEGSLTVIELLERYVPSADAIIVLLTPDDEGRRRGEDSGLEPRARQNVLIEAGFAVISKRTRSLLIAFGGVSIPSDFEGIHRIQAGSWSPEVAMRIAQRLRDMGLAVEPAQAI